MTELLRYVVQSSQVRGERRSYWIEERPIKRMRRHPAVIEDCGTDRRKAERRCDELNKPLPCPEGKTP